MEIKITSKFSSFLINTMLQRCNFRVRMLIFDQPILTLVLFLINFSSGFDTLKRHWPWTIQKCYDTKNFHISLTFSYGFDFWRKRGNLDWKNQARTQSSSGLSRKRLVWVRVPGNMKIHFESIGLRFVVTTSNMMIKSSINSDSLCTLFLEWI